MGSYLGFIEVLFEFHLDFIWVAFGLHLGFIYVSFGFHFDFILVSIRFHRVQFEVGQIFYVQVEFLQSCFTSIWQLIAEIIRAIKLKIFIFPFKYFLSKKCYFVSLCDLILLLFEWEIINSYSYWSDDGWWWQMMALISHLLHLSIRLPHQQPRLISSESFWNHSSSWSAAGLIISRIKL